MKVFRLGPSAEGFADLALVDDTAPEQLVRGFNGTSMADSWVPPLVEAVREEADSGPELGDYAQLSTVPVLNSRAVNALARLLAPHGEFLPLRSPEALFAYNVTTVLDALDERRSSIKRFASGEVMWITKHAFLPERLKGAVAFKVPQLRRTTVFVSGEVVEAAREAELRGFGFYPAWERG